MTSRHAIASSLVFSAFALVGCTPGTEVGDEVDYNITSDGVDCYETAVEPERREVTIAGESCEQISCAWSCARFEGLDRRDVELVFRRCGSDPAFRLVDRAEVDSRSCEGGPDGSAGYATCPAQPCCLCCAAGSRPCGSECIPEDQACDRPSGCACWLE